MPGTITVATLNPTITKANLIEAVRTAMTAAGFAPPIDVITGTTDSLIYAYQFNTQTKGTTYIRININTTPQIQQQMGDNWDTVNKTGTTYLGWALTSVTTNLPLTLISVNHPEMRLVMLQGSAISPRWLGYIRPATKPVWWDEKQFLYCYNPSINTGDGNNIAPNPMGFTNSTTFEIVERYVVDLNPLGIREIATAPVWKGLSGGGRLFAGRFSEEIVSGSGSSTAVLDKFQVSGLEEYTILQTNGNNAIALRTT